MSTPGAESLDARLVRFRSRGNLEDGQPLVRDLLDAGRAAEAAEVAEALTEATPSSFDAWCLLATAREADRDPAAAQRAWLEAARRTPERPEPYRHIADLLLARGDLDRAERIVARGLDLVGPDAELVARRERVASERARQAPAAPNESLGPAVSISPVAPAAPAPPAPAPAPAAPASRAAPVHQVATKTPIAPAPAVILERSSVPPEARLSSTPTPARAPAAAKPLPPKPKPPVPFRQPTPAWPPTSPAAAERPTTPMAQAATREPIPSGSSAPKAAAAPLVAGPTVPQGVVAIQSQPPAASALPSRGAALPPAPTVQAAIPASPTAVMPASGASAADEPAEEYEIDPESTLVASRAELEQLRNLGAILPAEPPMKHKGAPWSDSDDEPPSPFVTAPPPPPPTPSTASTASVAKAAPGAPTETIRVRGDATVPYRKDKTSGAPPAAAPSPSPSASPKSAGAAVPDESIHERITYTPGKSMPPLGEVGRSPQRSDIGESTSSLSGSGPHSRRPGKKRRPALVVVGFALVGAIGGTVAIRWKTTSDQSARFDAATVGLFEADARATRSAHEAARSLGARATEEHRDLRLESELIRFIEVGGLTSNALREARLAARTHGVDPAWLAAASAAEAWIAGDRSLASRLLGPTSTLPTDARLAFVQAGLASRLDRRGDAHVLLAGLERLTHGAPSVVIALAELDRAEGKPEDATRRITVLLRAHANHARARLMQLSIALDSGTSAETLSAGNLEAAFADASAAEKAWADAVLARLDVAAGRTADAVRRVDRAKDVAGLAPAIVLDVAAAELALGRAAQARARLDAAFGNEPTDARARHQLGVALANLGRGDEALALLPESGDSSTLEARALAALHASSDRARSIADAIRALGASASTRMRAFEIRLRLAAGDEPGALLERAETLRADHPNDRDVLVAYAACAAAADRWDTLSSNFGADVAAAPELAAFRARSAMRRGAIPEAEQALTVLASTAPTAPDTLVVRAYVQREKGELDAALATYRDLVGTEGLVLEGPARVVGLVGQAGVLLSLGREPEARAAFAQLTDSERAAPSAAVVRARLALASGLPAEAIAALETRAAATTAPAEVLYVFADAVLASGDADRAIELYRRAITADAAMPEPHLGLANVFVRIEHFDEANSELVRSRRALDARPRGPAAEGVYFTLFGRMALGKGDKEEARFALRRATTFAGVPNEAYFFLGEALSGSNSPDARAAYERYLGLAPQGDFAERARRAL